MKMNISKSLVKIKMLFSGEVVFAIFILAGNIKSGLSFIPSFIDVTIFFLGLSILIAIKRHYTNTFVIKGSTEAIILFDLFSIFLLASLFYTFGTDYAIDKTLRFLIITGWSYLGVFFLIKSEVSIKKFLNGLIFVALIMSVPAIYNFSDNLLVGEQSTISVMGSNNLALGRTVGIGILILTNLYFVKEKRKNMTLFLSLIILLMTIILFVSGARMPLISLIMIFMIYIISSVKFSLRKIYLRKGFKKAFLFIALLTIIIIILVNLGVFDLSLKRLLILFQGIGSDSSAIGRWMRYLVAINMWIEKPLIGYGVGSFPLFYSGIDSRDYPHNIFLEVVAELGIVGLVSFLLLIGNSLYKGWIVYRKKYKEMGSLQITIILVFLFLFFNANISGDFNDNRLMFTFISLLSISPFLKKENE